jgi:hypothetical protein
MENHNYSRQSFWLNSIYAGFARHAQMSVPAFLLAVIILSSCSTTSENVMIPENAMVIQEQGSFAVGGSVITNPGTFDAIERTSEGQTFHGDHASIFYQIPDKTRKLPLVSGTASDSFPKPGKPHPTVGKAFKTYF